MSLGLAESREKAVQSREVLLSEGDEGGDLFLTSPNPDGKSGHVSLENKEEQ